MKQDWLRHCLALSKEPADFYSGARKILRNRHFTIHPKQDLTLVDCGFTKSKLSMLVRNYVNEESRAAAKTLWQRRLEQDKYGSVGFTCYNHYVKGGGLGYGVSSKLTGVAPRPGGMYGGRRRKGDEPSIPSPNKRASVMGPCIQALTLTLLPDRTTAVDLYYRTTEIFKKFPADLVFIRDVLLEGFDADIAEMNFHFANVTCHPMYFVTIIPLLVHPIDELERIRKADKHFFDWTVKWTARYLVPKYFRGIEKFAQAMRVRKDALERIKSPRPLIRYLTDHHPGYRNTYEAPDDEEEAS